MSDPIDIYEIRRQRLLHLLHSKFGGKKAALARAINNSDSYINRILSEPGAPSHKNIGERQAAQITMFFPDWLEGVEVPASIVAADPLTPEERQTVRDLRAMLPEDAAIWRAQIHAVAEKIRRARRDGPGRRSVEHDNIDDVTRSG